MPSPAQGVGEGGDPAKAGRVRAVARQEHDETDRARALRRQMTDAERKLWTRLRNRGMAGSKFRRQVPIGRFFADFACVERRLVVEVDGGQHAQPQQNDARRTGALASHGYTVLRFWSSEVLQNLDGVLARIEVALRND
jgi:very-short-patch-repair endonuclease